MPDQSPLPTYRSGRNFLLADTNPDLTLTPEDLTLGEGLVAPSAD